MVFDAYGQPVEVEPIADAPPRDAWEEAMIERETRWLKAMADDWARRGCHWEGM
jgi:hypothetical protein